MKTRRAQHTGGFSLVEVVLALGIATFGLVSILGLLNAATSTDSDAGRDTTLVAMSDYVLNDLQAMPFDALWSDDPTKNWNAAISLDTPKASTYYFTNEGAYLTASQATGNADLLYKCVVVKTADTNSQNPFSGAFNQLKLQLEFSWPATTDGNPGKAGSKTLYASIARQ